MIKELLTYAVNITLLIFGGCIALVHLFMAVFAVLDYYTKGQFVIYFLTFAKAFSILIVSIAAVIFAGRNLKIFSEE